MHSNNWEITINRFDGLAPGFWKNTNLTQGNKEHASDLQNVDLIDPNVLTQGPGLVALTNNTSITTLIKGIQKVSIVGVLVCGVGGNKLYEFSSSSITNTGVWPHTIDKATVTGEDGEDVCYLNTYLYYSYNHSGGAGDIGRYDGATTFDDDYMSTVPTGATTLVGGVPHQMIVGGDNNIYITNGKYIAKYTAAAVFTDQVLDFPDETVTTSLCFEHNKLYIAARRPNPTTATYIESSIYEWDCISSSWSYQIRVPGKIGAIFSKNGVVYLFYQDITSTGGFKLACVNGNQIRDLVSYTGSLPEYYQVIDYENHLLWLSSGEVWAWGAAANDLPVKLFQYADAGYATAGGITTAFGTPIIASYTGSTYQLAKFSGYDVNAYWRSILFDVNSALNTSIMDRIVVITEPLSTGARMDVTVTSNYGANTITTPTSIAYDATQTTKTRWVIERNGAMVDSFRVNLSWANGSATNPVKVRKIIISGHFITNQ
jgi:hypothetical protein